MEKAHTVTVGPPFLPALVNRGRDAAWAKSYGSIG
jgi:hypothetical protein